MSDDEEFVEHVEDEEVPEPSYTHKIRGTGGKFWVTLNQDTEDKKSVAIHYVNTHLRIGEDVFSALETFREAFDEEQLNFEHILQRDINDYRVSTQMIPYILGSNQHVHGYRFYSENPALFYPPIVCILIPFEKSDGINIPSKFYNDVYTRPNHDQHPTWENWTVGQGKPSSKMNSDCITLGGPNEENFTLWKPNPHSTDSRYQSSVIQFNNNRTKLIMIDGQHRGMSLLALHRNLNAGWDNASKKRYEPFYEEWKAEHLQNFDLTELNLPMIVCVAPDCIEKNNLDITEISRKIFLTLNKTAKPVSDSRTLLMNDTDLPAEFMRKFLEKISESSTADISSILRGQKETSRSVNPLQFTSIEAGIYPIFEDLVMASLTKTRNYAERRINTKGAISRLISLSGNLPQILGRSIDSKLTRKAYSKQDVEIMLEDFEPLYIDPMIKITENFALINSCTVKKTHPDISSISVDGGPLAVHNLWSGTRRGDIVEDYKKAVAKKESTLLAAGEYLKQSKQNLETIQAAEKIYKDKIIEIQKQSALGDIQHYEHLSDDVVRSIFELLREDMFVGSVYLSFFDIVERCEWENRDDQDLGSIVEDEDRVENRKKAVETYTAALNQLFKPSSVEILERFLCAFNGRSVKSNTNFDDTKEINSENNPFKTKKKKSWIASTWAKKEFDCFPHYSVLLNMLWHSYLQSQIAADDVEETEVALFTNLTTSLESWLDNGMLQAQKQNYLQLKKTAEREANDNGETWEWTEDKQIDAAKKSINTIKNCLDDFVPDNNLTTWLDTEKETQKTIQLIRNIEPSNKNLHLLSTDEQEATTESDDEIETIVDTDTEKGVENTENAAHIDNIAAQVEAEVQDTPPETPEKVNHKDEQTEETE